MATTRIIKRSKKVECVHYERFFQRIGDPGSGYGFECSPNGVIDETAMTPVKRQSLASARNAEKYIDRGLQVIQWDYIEPAELRCDCGGIVTLDGRTNECGCGRDYDMSGNLLAPRAQWGEETGEHWTECA